MVISTLHEEGTKFSCIQNEASRDGRPPPSSSVSRVVRLQAKHYTTHLLLHTESCRHAFRPTQRHTERPWYTEAHLHKHVTSDAQMKRKLSGHVYSTCPTAESFGRGGGFFQTDPRRWTKSSLNCTPFPLHHLVARHVEIRSSTKLVTLHCRSVGLSAH